MSNYPGNAPSVRIKTVIQRLDGGAEEADRQLSALLDDGWEVMHITVVTADTYRDGAGAEYPSYQRIVTLEHFDDEEQVMYWPDPNRVGIIPAIPQDNPFMFSQDEMLHADTAPMDAIDAAQELTLVQAIRNGCDSETLEAIADREMASAGLHLQWQETRDRNGQVWRTLFNRLTATA